MSRIDDLEEEHEKKKELFYDHLLKIMKKLNHGYSAFDDHYDYIKIKNNIKEVESSIEKYNAHISNIKQSDEQKIEKIRKIKEEISDIKSRPIGRTPAGRRKINELEQELGAIKLEDKKKYEEDVKKLIEDKEILEKTLGLKDEFDSLGKEYRKTISMREKSEEREGHLSKSLIPDTFYKGLNFVIGGGSPIRKVIGLVIFCLIGMSLMVLLGNWWFFAAFLFWALFLIMPEEENLISAQETRITNFYDKKIADIRKDIEKLIEKKKYVSKNRKEEINDEIIELRDQIETLEEEKRDKINTVIAKFRDSDYREYKKGVNTREVSKNLFKIAAFFCIVVAFLSSNIPLAKPIGLIIGFFLYMTLGGVRDLKEIEKK